MTLNNAPLIRVILQRRRIRDQQWFIDMPKTNQPFLLDEPGQQLELKCLGKLGVEATGSEKQISSIQPMTRHDQRKTEQQVEVEPWQKGATQAAIRQALQLVTINCTALRVCRQLEPGDHQATGGELIAGVGQHEPGKIALIHYAVNLRRQGFIAQSNEMQLIRRRGFRYISATGQYHDLQSGIQAALADQAL